MRTFPELVLRTTVTWRPFFEEIIYVCLATGQDYHDFPFQKIFSPDQMLKFSMKTSWLFF